MSARIITIYVILFISVFCSVIMFKSCLLNRCSIDSDKGIDLGIEDDDIKIYILDMDTMDLTLATTDQLAEW